MPETVTIRKETVSETMIDSEVAEIAIEEQDLIETILDIEGNNGKRYDALAGRLELDEESIDRIAAGADSTIKGHIIGNTAHKTFTHKEQSR